MTPIEIVTFDLDSTLCDTSHRHAMIPLDPEERKRYDWSIYSKACADDVPFAPAVVLANMLARIYPLYIVSGRHGSATDITREWLVRNDVPFSGMFLDDEGYVGPHTTYKVNRMRGLQEQGYDIKLHVDDYPIIRYEIQRQLGIPVLIITPAYDDATALSPASVR